ncbi:LysR substrate-binding domain-containing protein [Sorangium sp. So ce307]
MGKLAAGVALKCPEVRLEVTTEDRTVDMIEEGYDLVIRVNPAPDESLVGRILLRDRLVVVASRASLDKRAILRFQLSC